MLRKDLPPRIVEYFEQRMQRLGASEDDYTVKVFDEAGVRRSRPLFAPGPQGIEIYYLDLSGDLQLIGKKDRTRRYVATRLHDDLVTDGRKYLNPSGVAVRPWIPPRVVNAFQQREKIRTLYLIEGQFKAFSGSLHGLPVIAIPGIHNFRQTWRDEDDPERKAFHEDILHVIDACQVEEVVMLHDADALELSSSDTPDKDRSVRPRSFAASLVNFRKACKMADVRARYAHISPNLPTNPKGLDDLLEAFRGESDEIISQLETGETSGFWQGFLIRDTREIRDYFAVSDVRQFFLRFSGQLGDEFIFKGRKVRSEDILKDQGPSISARPGARYVSEYSSEILQAVLKSQHFILKSRPNSGKTTAFLMPGGICEELNRATGLPVAFVTPTLPTGRQSVEKNNHPFIRGGTTSAEVEEAVSRGVFILSSGSLEKVWSRRAEIIFIVDEIHDVVDAKYRDNGRFPTMSRLFQAMQESPYAIGITGTPYQVFEFVGFPIVDLHTESRQRFSIHTTRVEGDPVPAMISYLETTSFDGLRVVRINNRLKARQIIHRLQALRVVPGRMIELNSDIDDDDRKHLELTGKIREDVSIAFVTSLIDLGVNIENPSTEILICEGNAREKLSPESVAQIVARARVPESVNVRLFVRDRTSTKKKEPSILSDSGFMSVLADGVNHLCKAVEACKDAGMPDERMPSFPDDTMDKQPTRTGKSGKMEPNPLYLMRSAIERRNEVMTTDDLLRMVAQLVPNCSLKEVTVSDTENPIAEQEALQRIENIREDVEVIELIDRDAVELLKAAAKCKRKKVQLRADKALAALGYSEPESCNPEYAQYLNETQSELFPLLILCDMIANHRHGIPTVTSIFRHAAGVWRESTTDKLASHESKTGDHWDQLAEKARAKLEASQGRMYFDRETFTEIASRLEVARLIHFTSSGRDGSALSPEDRFKAGRYQEFRDRLRVGRSWSRATIEKHYRELFPGCPESKVKERAENLLRRLFFVELERKGKRFDFLLKSRRKTAHLFSEIGLNPDDLLPENTPIRAIKADFRGVAANVLKSDSIPEKVATPYKNSNTTTGPTMPPAGQLHESPDLTPVMTDGEVPF